jgi:uncharacterized protein YegP (UPF0339 family)
MVEFFTDEQGEYRFRIKGRNGEVLATSEGYTREDDARRGFWDLARAVANASRGGSVG